MLEYLRRLRRNVRPLTETANRTADTAAAENRDLNDVEASSFANIRRCAEIDGALVVYNNRTGDQARTYATLLDRIEASTTTTPDERITARNGGAQIEDHVVGANVHRLGPRSVRTWVTDSQASSSWPSSCSYRATITTAPATHSAFRSAASRIRHEGASDRGL